MSSNKVMADVQDALKYNNAGRTWRSTTYNLVDKISVKIPEPKPAHWQHLVIALPQHYLRNSAVGVSDFKKNAEGKAMMMCFSFFIDMVNRMATSEGLGAGQSVAIFWEWVVDKDRPNICVGHRLHVFCNRLKTFSHITVDQMLAEHKKARKLRKKNGALMPYEEHMKISSRGQYCAQVCDIYRRDHHATLALDTAPTDPSSHPANPTNVFSLEKAFIFKNGRDIQSSILNYRNGEDKFHFPDESCIYRVEPSDLDPDILFNKFLPHYYFNRVHNPSVQFYTDRITTEQNRQYVEMHVAPHLHREGYTDFLNQVCKKVDNESDVWMAPIDLKDKIIETMEGDFFIYDRKETPNQIPFSQGLTGTKTFMVCHHYMNEDRLQKCSLNADATPIMSPIIKTLLFEKHSLSDIDVISLRAKFRLSQLTKKYEGCPDKTEFIKEYRMYQEEMLQEFIEKCWNDADSLVSDAAKHIILWNTHTRPKDLKFQYKKIDPTMSVWGNRTIRLLEFYDKGLFVSATHKTLFLLNHSKYDAYRQETNLHFNQIYTGEGATSKSFMFSKMDLDMSIPGTVQSLTYSTTRADAIDDDQIDQIDYFNEAPPGMFITDQKCDPNLQQMMKNRLTENKITVKEFYRDEITRERKNRVAVSQFIGVVMGATNDDPSQAEEAMVTRFYWGQFSKVEGNGRTIQTCQRGERELPACEAASALKREGQWYCKDEQMKMFLLFKMMYMNIIKKPSLKAADIVYDTLGVVMKKKYKISFPPRTKERFEILCTIFTMVNALETVFNMQGGLHCGKDFDPIMLLDVEPLLWCTEEIALFALCQISEELCNPNEYKVLKAIWDIHKQTQNYKEKKEGGDSSDITATDYNYIKLPKTNRLILEITNRMPASGGKMSQHNIRSLLKHYSETSISTPVYVDSSEVGDSERKYNDGFPESIGNKKLELAMTKEFDHTYFLMDLFKHVRKGEYIDQVKDCIKSIQHKHTRKKKVMLGNPKRVNSIIKYPNVFDVMTLTPNPNKEHKMVNPLYISNLTHTIYQSSTGKKSVLGKRQRNRKIKINHDLDITAALHRCKLLQHKPEHFMNKYFWMDSDLNVSDTTINYPHDILESYKENTNEDEMDDEAVSEYTFDSSSFLSRRN